MARFYPFTRQNSRDDITNKLAFYKNKNGKELGLSAKLAMVLPPGAPPELPDAIGSFTTLRSIDISQNFLRFLTPRISQLQGNLQELNASHNMLSDVSEVALLTSLHNLDLSYNCLRPSHLKQLTSLVQLKELNLAHNLLYSDDSHPENPFEPTTSSPPTARRASLGPTSLIPRNPVLNVSPSVQSLRKMSSAPPTISSSPPTSSLDTSADTASETSTNEELGTSPSAFTSVERLSDSPIPVILMPTPVHPDSTPNSSPSLSTRSRTPSPTLTGETLTGETLTGERLTSPTPANTPIPSPAPSPVPFPRQLPLSITLSTQLEVLVLSANQLQAFPEVHTLVALTKLDLSENKIIEVPANLYTQLVNLKELNLQGNLIERLPPMMKSLKKLNVDNNPLHATYSLMARNGELLSQLQSMPDADTSIPRSSSDSAIISPPGTTPPTPVRSATPPPNGFLSRIFRKDHSASDSISPKAKSQPTSTPATPEDSARVTSPEPQPSQPQPQPQPQNDSGTTNATETSDDSTRSATESGNTTEAKKKRSISVPGDSPTLSGVPAALFGVVPPIHSFPTSPTGQPTPTELYLEFVKKLKQTQNIKSSIDSFVTRIKTRALDPDDLQAALRDFVQNTHTTLSAHALWKKASPTELQEAELHLQEYVLEHLYDHIFAARPEDREKDLELNLLIKRFYFITPEHLDITIFREHEDIWRRAEQQILQINSTRSVRSKMRCVVRMCRDLIAALARAQGDNLGADVLLPHLIFTILHANPPHLHSNIVYMTRFSESEASETIYYITQLVAAIYFIEHIEASSLNIDADEFNQRVNESPRIPPTSRITTIATSAPSTPARANRLTLSGNNIVFTPDVTVPTLVRALESKRREYTSLGQGETAKWVTDNDALISQCVGLSREVLPALPTISPIHPLAPPPRFEGVRMEDLRAIEIPQLLEDYHRIVALLRQYRPPSPLSSVPLPSTTPSSSSSLSSSSSPSPSPRASPIPYTPSPQHSPSIPHSSLISFNHV